MHALYNLLYLKNVQNIPEILKIQKAFYKSQKTKNLNYRLSILKSLKKEILDKEQAILDALYNDFKKSNFETFISEFGLVISELNLAIKNLKKWAKPKRVKSSLLTFPSKDYIYKDPYGNVLIIAPWNYPFLLALEPLIMAIAAGNTVVLKPSELTQSTSKIITQIIKNVFLEDLAISIEGGVETSTELLAQKWDYIFFTGSTKVGKIVAEAAAKNLTPVTLELGGKSPCIIDETVNLNLVAKRLAWGKYFNGGQTCIAPDYVIVKSDIKEKLIDNLKKEIIKMYGNTPEKSNDLPRIINKNNTLRLKKLIENQDVIFGGHIVEDENYISPTLINAPSLDSTLMSEEIFGPILPILDYKTYEDIESIIYGLDKPLSLYIFSNNKSFADFILNSFNFGGGVVNDVLVHFGNHKLPFGGIGGSGMGQYHGKHGFDTFSHHKSVMKRGNWIDPSFRYPPYRGKLNLLKKIFKFLG
ncbi:aldehyde dehydrogenase [Litoribaculum gwangyangense]|uniref:Aldehyde dehydrogenase n=1 Tax=Litoribaculum gwangyangense TaxID=1130722 RepID=A0ABP9CHB9_9FLAO